MDTPFDRGAGPGRPNHAGADSGGLLVEPAVIATPVRLVPFMLIPFSVVPFIEIPFIEIPFIEIPFIEIPFWLMPFWLSSPTSSSPGAAHAPHIRATLTMDLIMVGVLYCLQAM